MAQEGVAAALRLDDNILNDLAKAQERVEAMSKAASAMADSFKSVGESVSKLAGNIKGSGVSLKDAVNASGAMKDIGEVGAAATALGQKMSEVKKQFDISDEIKRTREKLQELQKTKLGMDRRDIGFSHEDYVKTEQEIDQLKQKLQSLLEARHHAFSGDPVKQAAGSFREYIASLTKTNDGLKQMNAYYRELEKSSAKEAKTAREIADAQKSATDALAMKPKGIEQTTEKLKELQAAKRQLDAESKKAGIIDPSVTARVNLELDRTKLKLQSIRSELSSTGKNATMVRSLLSQAFSPILIQRFLQQMITVRGEFEMAQKSLAVIIRSESRAQQMFSEITKMAVRSPFSVSSILQQTKQLAAYRIETDKLIETTKMLGDISAGVGVDMNRLILAYGQVKAAEFLKGTELRQFSEAGVNMLGGLAERFSEIYNRTVSVGEVMQMVSKRMVKFKDVEAVLKSVTEAGGAFYKMQEQQADTLRGRLVNLGDRIQIAFNEMGKSYDAFMKKLITGIENIISHWEVISTTIIPILTGKLASGAVGILARGWQNMSATLGRISKQITIMNMATVISGRNLNTIRKGINAIGGAIAGIGLAGVVQIVATIAALVWQIAQNANRLQKTIDRIAKDANASAEQQEIRFSELLDIAADINKKESDRKKALEALKTEYGNILNLQGIELGNIGKLNDARRESIELIRIQAQEEARVKAMSEAISELDQGEKRRSNNVWTSTMEGSMLARYAESEGVAGFKEIAKEDSDAARKEVEEAIKKGVINGVDDARKEYIKKVLTMAGATGEQIANVTEKAMNVHNDGMEKSFEKVLDAMGKVNGMFSKSVATDIAKNARIYRDAINDLEKVRQEFDFDKPEYGQNPQQGELDFRVVLNDKMLEVQDQIITAFNAGKISEGMMNKLLDELQKKFKKEAGIGSAAEEYLKSLQKQINEKYPKLKIPMGTGVFAKEAEESMESHVSTVKKQLKSMREDIDAWNENVPQMKLFELKNTWGTKEELETMIKAVEDYIKRITGSASTDDNNNNDAKSKWSSFISALKSARKEMDKLNKQGTEKYIEKLRELGKQVGVTLNKSFSGTDEEIMALIDKYKKRLSSVERIDVELSLITDEAEDKLEVFRNQVSDLWDQYDTSKKLEEWGLVPDLSSAEAMRQIGELEARLRSSVADGDRKLAEEIAKKRLQIARNEQEEIAKIMYEAQKKSLDKIGQAYADMREKIGIISRWENADERNAAISAQIAKSTREIADAQWDAFKATESYSIAFGNLEDMSRGALTGLRSNLEAWARHAKDALQPSEYQAIYKQIHKIDDLLSVEKTKTITGGILKAFKEVGEAGQQMEGLKDFELDMISALNEEKAATDRVHEANIALNKAKSDRDAAGIVRATIELKNAEDAEARAKDKSAKATSLYQRALAQVSNKLKTANNRVSEASEAFSAYSGAVNASISFMKDFASAFNMSFSPEASAAMEGISSGMALVGSAISVASAAMKAYTIATMKADGATKTLLATWWPLVAVLVAVAAAVAAVKARDAALKKEVEDHKDVVEQLEKAYDKLEKAMDAALDASRLRSSFAEMNANLEKQRQELNEAIDANNKRKQTDEVKKETRELEEQLDAIEDKADDLKDAFYEALGVTTDSRGLAQNWSSDWLKAFKETGSGLKALRDDFDELYDDLVVGQLWSTVMGQQIEKLQDMIKAALSDSRLSDAEAAAIRAYKDTLSSTSEMMEAEARRLGIRPGSLSEDTLQRGVQTITEQTGSALESIANRVSYDVSDTNARMANIELALVGEGENTILSQLRSQTRYLADIARIASAVYYSGAHPKGAGALKVITEMA